MKIASVISSYKSKSFTKRLYKELKNIKGHDVFVLENSPYGEAFMCEDTIWLGEKNVGFGGMRDFMFWFKPFRKYEFVGLWNNDVYGVNQDYLSIFDYANKNTGIISSVFNKKGTGWEHMRKQNKGSRNVQHIEDIACYFNTELFDKIMKYTPFPYWGVLDIVLSAIYKINRYELTLVDDVVIHHQLSAIRKYIGTLDEYLKNFPAELNKWIEERPEIKKYCDKYYESIRNNS